MIGPLKIELSWRVEIILGLVISAVSGAVFGRLVNFGYFYGTELNASRFVLA